MGNAHKSAYAHLKAVVGRREFARYALEDVEAAYDRGTTVIEGRREAARVLEQRIAELEAEAAAEAEARAAARPAGGGSTRSSGSGSTVGQGEGQGGSATARRGSSDTAPLSPDAAPSTPKSAPAPGAGAAAQREIQSQVAVGDDGVVPVEDTDELLRSRAELAVIRALEPSLLTRREFLEVFTDFSAIGDGCVLALSLGTFRTFAQPCLIRGDRSMASLQVVDLEELLVVLALYCNRDEEEATDALNLLYDVFAGEAASHIPREDLSRFLTVVYSAGFKIKLFSTAITQESLDKIVDNAVTAADVDENGLVERTEFIDWASAVLLSTDVRAKMLELREGITIENDARASVAEQATKDAQRLHEGHEEANAKAVGDMYAKAKPEKKMQLSWDITLTLAKMRLRARSSVMVASRQLVKQMAKETYLTLDELTKLRAAFSRAVVHEAVKYKPVVPAPTPKGRKRKGSSAAVPAQAERRASAQPTLKFKRRHFRQVMTQLYPNIANNPTTIDRIFDGFDTDNDGTVDFREFAIGLGKMAYGTQKEKLDMLFNIHAQPVVTAGRSGSAPRVRKEMMMHMSDLLHVARESQDAFSDAAVFTADMIRQLDINGDGVVSRDEFLHMVEKSPVLLNIMTNCLLPGTDGMRGPFEDWSARHTKFGMALVVKLWNKYSFLGMDGTPEVDLARFRRLMREEFKVGDDVMPVVNRMFDAMDVKDVGAVHWREVFFRLARVAHGTREEKATFLFAIMDNDGSGDLQSDEVMRFLLMSAEGSGAPQAYREDMAKLIQSYSDEDGNITKSSFIAACEDNPSLLSVFASVFGAEVDPRRFTRKTVAQRQAKAALNNIKAMLNGQGLFAKLSQSKRRSVKSDTLLAGPALSRMTTKRRSSLSMNMGLVKSLDLKTLQMAADDVKRQQDATAAQTPSAKRVAISTKVKAEKQRELVEEIMARAAAQRAMAALHAHQDAAGGSADSPTKQKKKVTFAAAVTKVRRASVASVARPGPGSPGTPPLGLKTQSTRADAVLERVTAAAGGQRKSKGMSALRAKFGTLNVTTDPNAVSPSNAGMRTAALLAAAMENAKRKRQHSQVLRAHGRAMAMKHLPAAYEELRRDLMAADVRITRWSEVPHRPLSHEAKRGEAGASCLSPDHPRSRAAKAAAGTAPPIEAPLPEVSQERVDELVAKFDARQHAGMTKYFDPEYAENIELTSLIADHAEDDVDGDGAPVLTPINRGKPSSSPTDAGGGSAGGAVTVEAAEEPARLRSRAERRAKRRVFRPPSEFRLALIRKAMSKAMDEVAEQLNSAAASERHGGSKEQEPFKPLEGVPEEEGGDGVAAPGDKVATPAAASDPATTAASALGAPPNLDDVGATSVASPDPSDSESDGEAQIGLWPKGDGTAMLRVASVRLSPSPSSLALLDEANPNARSRRPPGPDSDEPATSSPTRQSTTYNKHATRLQADREAALEAESKEVKSLGLSLGLGPINAEGGRTTGRDDVGWTSPVSRVQAASPSSTARGSQREMALARVDSVVSMSTKSGRGSPGAHASPHPSSPPSPSPKDTLLYHPVMMKPPSLLMVAPAHPLAYLLRNAPKPTAQRPGHGGAGSSVNSELAPSSPTSLSSAGSAIVVPGTGIFANPPHVLPQLPVPGSASARRRARKQAMGDALVQLQGTMRRHEAEEKVESRAAREARAVIRKAERKRERARAKLRRQRSYERTLMAVVADEAGRVARRERHSRHRSDQGESRHGSEEGRDERRRRRRRSHKRHRRRRSHQRHKDRSRDTEQGNSDADNPGDSRADVAEFSDSRYSPFVSRSTLAPQEFVAQSLPSLTMSLDQLPAYSPRKGEAGDTDVMGAAGDDVAFTARIQRPQAVGGVRSLFTPDVGKEGLMLSAFAKRRAQMDLLTTLSPASTVMQNEGHKQLAHRAAMARMDQAKLREEGPPQLGFAEGQLWKARHRPKSPRMRVSVSRLVTPATQSAYKPSESTVSLTATPSLNRSLSSPTWRAQKQRARHHHRSQQSLHTQSLMTGSIASLARAPGTTAAKVPPPRVLRTDTAQGRRRRHQPSETSRAHLADAFHATDELFTPQGQEAYADHSATQAVTNLLLKTLAMTNSGRSDDGSQPAVESDDDLRDVEELLRDSPVGPSRSPRSSTTTTPAQLPHPLVSNLTTYVRLAAPQPGTTAAESKLSEARRHQIVPDVPLTRFGQRQSQRRARQKARQLRQTAALLEKEQRRMQVQRGRRTPPPTPLKYDVDELRASLRQLRDLQPPGSRRRGSDVRARPNTAAQDDAMRQQLAHARSGDANDVSDHEAEDVDDASVYSNASDDLLYQLGMASYAYA